MTTKLKIAIIVLGFITGAGYIIWQGQYISLSNGGGASPEKASTLKFGKKTKGTIRDVYSPHWFKVEVPQGKTLYISGFEIEDGYLKVDGRIYNRDAQIILKSADANFQELQFTNNTDETEFFLWLAVPEGKTQKKYNLFANIVDEPAVRPTN